MKIKNFLVMAREARNAIDRLLESQRDKCQNCLYWRTNKCNLRPQQASLFPSDNACSEGIVIHFMGSDVTIQQGNVKIIKPFRYLTSASTKEEIMQKFELTEKEVEQAIIKIKQRCQFKTQEQPRTQYSAGGILDGTVYEQIQGQQYAIYEDGNVSISSEIEDHKPYDKLPYFMPSEATPYESELQLWNEIKDCLYQHLDLQQGYEILASWIMATWTPEKWKSVPYLFFYGPLSSGKTRGLEILSQLAYRGWLALFVTSANLFRPLEEWHTTLFLDESETYMDAREIIALLNGSYRRGQLVPRQVETKQGYETKFFDCFSFKCLAGTRNLAKTLASRCIIFRMSKATRKVRLFIDETQTQQLRNKLLTYRFKKRCGESDGSDDFLKRVELVAETLKDGRLTELFYSILEASPSDEIKEEIMKQAVTIGETRLEEMSVSDEVQVLDAILEAHRRDKIDKGLILVRDIALIFNETLSTKEEWTTRRIRAVAERIGFQKIKHRKGVAIKWNPKLLERLKEDLRYQSCFHNTDTHLQNQPQPSQTSQPNKNWLKEKLG